MRSIHSLEDLRKAKRELAVKRAITKQEFGRQLGVIRSDAGTYLIKKVVLPLGIGMVAAFAIKYFFSSKPDRAQPENATKKDFREVVEEHNKTSWLSYLSILLSMVKVFQGALSGSSEPAGPSEQEEAMAEDNGRQGATETPFSPRDFVANFRRQMAEKEME